MPQGFCVSLLFLSRSLFLFIDGLEAQRSLPTEKYFLQKTNRVDSEGEISSHELRHKKDCHILRTQALHSHAIWVLSVTTSVRRI